MRIKKVIVKKLFGIFDHEIPFKMKDHITIIHGPNGYGKTVILKTLNFLFSGNYHELRMIPFSEIAIHFDNKTVLFLKRNGGDTDSETKEIPTILIELSKYRSRKKVSFKVPIIKQKGFEFPLGMIEDEIPMLERIGPSTWRHIQTQEHLPLDLVISRYGYRLPLPRSMRDKEPPELVDIRNAINIRLIETQRLFAFVPPRRSREHDERASVIPVVIRYAEELTQAIQAKLAEYANLSQSLDRTFPTRLVKGSRAPDLTLSKLQSKLDELEQKRSRLMMAGFLDKEKEIDFMELQKIDDRNRNVLSVYVEDVQSKLSVFDELTNKIDLFVKIINTRFLYKQMSISKKDGFVITTSNGKILSASSLSSGEQHELVLLYDLLFKVKPNSLILIDEPELSLHVVWQQQFLKDLQEVTSLGGFDVLIATHSPLIIHDRWDLTVQLEGPEDGK